MEQHSLMSGQAKDFFVFSLPVGPDREAISISCPKRQEKEGKCGHEIVKTHLQVPQLMSVFINGNGEPDDGS